MCYETHGALVFAAGDDVYKIKRAVRFPYMDFSTLDLRERVIRREFEINVPNAPELYLGVIPVTREADGTLAIGGQGEAVEWALHMRRFADRDLLNAVAARGGIDRDMALAIADAVSAVQARAEVIAGSDGGLRLGLVLAEIGRRADVQVPQEALQRAVQQQAIREAQMLSMQGQQVSPQQVLKYFQQNPQAVAQIRAPLFEERVVDFILERSKVTDNKVSKEDLMKDPDGEE